MCYLSYLQTVSLIGISGEAFPFLKCTGKEIRKIRKNLSKKRGKNTMEKETTTFFLYKRKIPEREIDKVKNFT